MKTDDIRNAFLSYFKQEKHKELPSIPLPIDEPTLLFAVAGMVPLKKYFLGEDIPSNPRLTTAQRCLRTNDIEEVGRTSRHLTFFEMLGNFSVGDYFKKEAIEYAWDFMHQVMGIPMEKLWATVYPEDSEAVEFWKKFLPQDRIVPDKENFWKMADTGPSGFDSEIFYDKGLNPNCTNTQCNPLCECGRFEEIWNLVFMEFNLDAFGKKTPLPQKNIDTGMGLERLASIMQQVPTNFDIDVFSPVMNMLEKLSSKEKKEEQRRFRIIADHTRALAFLVADGVFPENQKHGYVLRRLLRRAKLTGFQLGIQDLFLWKLCEKVIESMGSYHQHLTSAKDKIQLIVSQEENQFQATLEDGFRLFHQERKKVSRVFSGASAFKLHDTFGFPVELTRELLNEHGLKLNEEEFKQCLKEQQNRAKKSKSFQSILKETEFWVSLKQKYGATVFLGYEKENEEATIHAIVHQGKTVDKADQKDASYLFILDKTPFFPEKGGPKGDQGWIAAPESRFKVEQTLSPVEDFIIHRGILTEGSFQPGDTVAASVDHHFRKAIRRAHTATHLLHRALKETVGEYINQAGSWIEPDYLRFDFNALKALTNEDLMAIEDKINAVISSGIYVCAQDMSFQEAMNEGATALFKEKYGEQVRVVSIENVSCELCGGIHTQNTCEIQLFRIISEGSIGSNLRRIEAVVGDKAIRSYREDARELGKIHTLLNKPNIKPLDGVKQLLSETKDHQAKLKQFQDKLVHHAAKEWWSKAEEVNQILWISGSSKDFSLDQLKILSDVLRQKKDKEMVILMMDISSNPGNLVLATSKAINAKEIWSQLQETFQLKGGGPPHLITGTRVNHEKIPQIQQVVRKMLNEISPSG